MEKLKMAVTHAMEVTQQIAKIIKRRWACRVSFVATPAVASTMEFWLATAALDSSSEVFDGS
jgi:hypothetical protein